jgi:hypothetical protein
MSFGKLVNSVTGNLLPIAGGFAAGVVTAPIVMNQVQKYRGKSAENKTKKFLNDQDGGYVNNNNNPRLAR